VQRFVLGHCHLKKKQIMRLIIAFVVLFAFASCKKSGNSNCQDGPGCGANIECVAFWSYFEFRLTDKNTGQDLVFGNNPRYQISDIKIYFDAARTYPMNNLRADNAAGKFTLMTARPEMYLEIKGSDVYKLTAEFRGYGCCANRVKNLWQDDQMVCTCCDSVIPLAVR